MIGRAALILIAVALLVAMLKRSFRKGVAADKPTQRVKSARKCPACGAYVIDGQPCACGHGS